MNSNFRSLFEEFASETLKNDKDVQKLALC